MRSSQQVCIWINKDQNDKFRSITKIKSKFFYISYVAWKIGILTKTTENLHFWLKIHKPQ